MHNTPTVKRTWRCALAGAFFVALGTGATQAAPPSALSARQQAIPLIAAFTATSDMPRLQVALNRGLDAGLSVAETKEILVQLYAYAGFPRSLNALGELMNVIDARHQCGITDVPGREPGRPAPTGAALIAAGTANQTRISGAPVKARSKNLLRVAFSACDARRTPVRLRFSAETAAARDGFSRCPQGAPVRLRPCHQPVPASAPVRRHLRARQPRLAKPRAGHGRRAGRVARS